MQKSTIVKILIIVSIVLAAGYLLVSGVWLSHKKTEGDLCKNLEVVVLDGDKIGLVGERSIIESLQRSGLYPVGKDLADVQAEEIERVLEKNPMIKRVECYLTPAGTAKIHVWQRIPKFRVMGSDENFYVDSERKLMPTSVNYAAYVPVVSGRLTKTFAAQELFDFVNFLEKNEFWNAQIEQIYVVENKDIELVPRVGDANILLGDLTNYPQKLKKLEKLYRKGFNTIGWNRYKTIDLRFHNQVVCTKKEGIQ
jgi:cell division protein FtsQ